MNKTITVSVGLLVMLSITFFLGFLVGRSEVKPVPPVKVIEVVYKDGKTVRDTVYRPVPYEVIVPDSIPVFIPADTAKLFAVWQDYYLKRSYKQDLSNDSVGELLIDLDITQNKLQELRTTFKPKVKIVYERTEITKVPLLQFYTMFGSSVDLSTNKIQAGVDFKQKYMIGASAIRQNNNYSYTIDLGIKF